MGTIETGRIGENLAAEYLTAHGHTILERNWRHSHLELDIISLDAAGELRIVEVKTRRAPLTADPVSNITHSKMTCIAKAAAAWLHSPSARLKLAGAVPEVQFDVITVVLGPDGAEINYYQRAYVPMFL